MSRKVISRVGLLLVAGTAVYAVLSVPSVRERCFQLRDDFLGAFAERETALLQALVPTEEEVQAAQEHRAQTSPDGSSF